MIGDPHDQNVGGVGERKKPNGSSIFRLPECRKMGRRQPRPLAREREKGGSGKAISQTKRVVRDKYIAVFCERYGGKLG